MTAHPLISSHLYDVERPAQVYVVSRVEARARQFRASFPYFIRQLDVISGNLSMRPWPEIVRYLTARIDAASEQRWVGFGGETARINMSALRKVAREMVANEALGVAAE